MTFPRAMVLSFLGHAVLMTVVFVGSWYQGPEALELDAEESPDRQAEVAELLRRFGSPDGTADETAADGEPGAHKVGTASMSGQAVDEAESESENSDEDDSDDASADSKPEPAKAEKSTESAENNPDEQSVDSEASDSEPSNSPKIAAASSESESTTDDSEPEPDRETDADSTDATPDDSEEDEASPADSTAQKVDSAEAGKNGAGAEAGSDDGADGSGSSGSAGGDGDSAVGRPGGDATRSGAGVDLGALKKGYNRSVFEYIQRHKEYPSLARRAGIDGRVVLDVVIGGDGRIQEVEIHSSSGHDMLDEAALETLRELNKLPSPPSELGWQRKRLRIPMTYRLDG